jgi:hypothetical protein
MKPKSKYFELRFELRDDGLLKYGEKTTPKWLRDVWHLLLDPYVRVPFSFTCVVRKVQKGFEKGNYET